MSDQNEDRREMLPEDAPTGGAYDTQEKLVFLGTPEQQNELMSALAEARAEFLDVFNDTAGQMGNRRFKYAPYENLVKATRAALAVQGIGVLQLMTGPGIDGLHRVTTIIGGHGAQIRASIDYRRAADIKVWGMQTTYLRRYAYRAAFGLDGSDDADGADAPITDRPRATPQQPPKAPTKQPPPKPAPKPVSPIVPPTERPVEDLPPEAIAAAAEDEASTTIVPEAVEELATEQQLKDIMAHCIRLKWNRVTAHARGLQIIGRETIATRVNKSGLEENYSTMTRVEADKMIAYLETAVK
jgi:hypothetical protein